MYFSKLVVFWIAVFCLDGVPVFNELVDVNKISIISDNAHTYNGIEYKNVHVSKKECEEFIKRDKLIYENEKLERNDDEKMMKRISLSCMAFAQDIPWQLGNKYRQITNYQRIKERIPLAYEPDEFSAKKWVLDENGKGIIVNNKRFDN